MTRLRTIVAVLLAFLGLAAVYTWPLAAQLGSHIASDPYDPILNASILWWNATVLPFSASWWNQPFFHPAEGVAAFTENLTGIGVIATPTLWVTGNPLTAYNLSLFLTWPLSAFTAYLLVLYLTRRQDAGVIAGLAYGFSPYRMAELGHLQSLSSQWMPLVLLGLHGYLDERRRWWLVLFGAAWLLQSLSNGYFMLLGGVLIGLWLLYFGARAGAWRPSRAIVLAWAVASLPLVPVMLRYYTIHEHFGMRRTMNEALAFSAPAWAWFEVSQFIQFWRPFLPEGDDKLFPGLTVVAIVTAVCVVAWRRGNASFAATQTLTGAAEPPEHVGSGFSRTSRARAALVVVAIASLTAAASLFITGPWRVTVAGFVIRMTHVDRALMLFLVAGGLLVWMTPWARHVVRRRSPFVFYVVATVVMGVLCWGPALRVGDEVILDPAPYRWLMYLPGFDQIRVPTRFWMLGIMCLATAAGLGVAWLAKAGGLVRAGLATLAVGGLLIDGWLTTLPMATPPEPWPMAELPAENRPILELPLGPAWDAAATWRSMWHRRPVFNGVSGYDPPHYAPLRAGLENQDPAMWPALASFGDFDVVVNGAEDAGGAWVRYVSGAAGADPIGGDGTRRTFRIPAGPRQEPSLGLAWPIAGVTASHHEETSMLTDGRFDFEWQYPHVPGQWMLADLGAVRDVAGVTHAMGAHPHDFPRLLRIDTSTDGSTWSTAWEGPTAARAFLAAVREPRRSPMPIAFPVRPARFVRLQQLADHGNLWRVAELSVHAPP